jgi:hypothetical protein
MPISGNNVIAHYYWNFKTQDTQLLRQPFGTFSSIGDTWEIGTGCMLVMCE